MSFYSNRLFMTELSKQTILVLAKCVKDVHWKNMPDHMPRYHGKMLQKRRGIGLVIKGGIFYQFKLTWKVISLNCISLT